MTPSLKWFFQNLIWGAILVAGMWFFYASTPSENLIKLQSVSKTGGVAGLEILAR